MSSTVMRPNLSVHLLASLILGIGCGLFFGEYVAVLSVIGDVFVGLLQMTVLPYIIVSLIANIGRLEPGEAKRFGLYAGAFMLLSLVITLAFIVFLPMSLPERESASFFSTSLLEEPEAVDFLELFIPSNPFRSLANNLVPAVVLFCIAVGVAIIPLPNKGSLLSQLDFLASALARVNSSLVKLTPIGIFAIATSFAGTMEVEELARLNVYIVLNVVATVVVGFGVLLPLLSALTPFSYGELFRAVWVPVLTAFATGKVFIVLPMLVESAEQLFARAHADPEIPSSYARATVPLMYSFPHAGKLLALLFLPFAAWFVDEPLALNSYPPFLAIGFFSLFGSPLAAIPLLLDLFELPADMFQLFVASGILTSRLGDALGAIHILFVSVLTASAISGGLQVIPRRLLVSAMAIVGMSVVATGAMRVYLDRFVKISHDRAPIIANMHASVHAAPFVVRYDVPEPPANLDEPALERVLRTGILRVGYLPDALPMSFFNAQGTLVGYDVDMAYLLAGQLGVHVEFVPFERKMVSEQLERGDFDIAMSGLPMLPANLARMRFAGPYLHVTVALVVPDYRRTEFRRRMEERDFRGVTIAADRSNQTGNFGEGLFPKASIVSTPSTRAFFDSDATIADALVASAETGSAWTLLYPNFSVVVTRPLFQIPVGYFVAKRDEAFAEFVSHWIELTRAGPHDEQLYEHWILGKMSTRHDPRWSVIRDVLGWVD